MLHGSGLGRPQGFTLIELLVVVTIIVVLLALLTPALDQALYQAELTVCGANMHGVAAGAISYAANNARNYPSRPGVNDLGKPNQLTDAWAGGEAAGKDDRPVINGYIPYSAFNEPLGDTLRFDPEDTDDDAFVYSGSLLWYGWQYKDGSTHAGLKKLGNRFSWAGTNQFGVAGRWRFDLLAGDHDMISVVNGGFINSHPDLDGSGYLWTRNNEYESQGTLGLGLDRGFKYVFSRWNSRPNTSHERGPVDMNFARTDGGVYRLSQVKWDDERVTSIPEFGDGSKGGQFWVNVPLH
jgi:prepilin-type N-terminal cleavage/methylation domain-containing protein